MWYLPVHGVTPPVKIRTHDLLGSCLKTKSWNSKRTNGAYVIYFFSEETGSGILNRTEQRRNRSRLACAAGVGPGICSINRAVAVKRFRQQSHIGNGQYRVGLKTARLPEKFKDKDIAQRKGICSAASRAPIPTLATTTNESRQTILTIITDLKGAAVVCVSKIQRKLVLLPVDPR